jgi:hypothetical protein
MSRLFFRHLLFLLWVDFATEAFFLISFQWLGYGGGMWARKPFPLNTYVEETRLSEWCYHCHKLLNSYFRTFLCLTTIKLQSSGSRGQLSKSCTLNFITSRRRIQSNKKNQQCNAPSSETYRLHHDIAIRSVKWLATNRTTWERFLFAIVSRPVVRFTNLPHLGHRLLGDPLSGGNTAAAWGWRLIFK